jgi:lysophospholipase L1-like esterase
MAIAASTAFGGIKYEFTGGSLAPTLSNLPAGVTADSIVLGAKFQAATGVSGNIFDDGGGPDSIRITGADGAPQTTGEAFSVGATLSFTIHIASGTTVSLKSTSLDYKGKSLSARSNARVFSTVRGRVNPANETIGVFGRDAGGADDAAYVVDTLDLVTPKTNTPWVGSTIQNGDFTNLAGPRDITFEIAWNDASTSATSYIDLDNLTLDFVGEPPPVVSSALKVTDFQVGEGHNNAQISFVGELGQPYSLMASADLTGPVYRKHWTLIDSGAFAGSDPIVYVDNDAVNFPKRFYVVSGGALPVAKIMCVGDSITEGSATDFFVYRGPLYDKLRTAQYRFEMVGTKTTPAGYYNSPVYGSVPLKHLGEGGANAAKVAQNFVAAFPSNPADIVLIHAGHNYDVATQTEAAIISAVETATRTMITTARNVNPKVKILLAQVITSTKVSENNSSVIKYGYIPALNARLAMVAAELSTEVAPIYIVNQAEGWNTPTDAVGDKVHPTAVGAEKMAVKWFDALKPLLE